MELFGIGAERMSSGLSFIPSSFMQKSISSVKIFSEIPCCSQLEFVFPFSLNRSKLQFSFN